MGEIELFQTYIGDIYDITYMKQLIKTPFHDKNISITTILRISVDCKKNHYVTNKNFFVQLKIFITFFFNG